MNDVLIKFKRHASRASYHYADDTCKEWDLARQDKNDALAIFDANPEMQDEMRKIASTEIWSLSKERPLTKEVPMKTRQQKADDIRDLVTQLNARIAELEEDGYKVLPVGGLYGKINEINITKTTKL